MKDKYIDHYGLDSLPHLIMAKDSGCEYFITYNKELLDNRVELEKIYDIKIRTPDEMLKNES